MSADTRIREVLAEFGETFNQDTVWRVQGTPVISHKALERIAARAGIKFDMPTIVRAERDEAVLLVAGSRNDQREWSIGECLVNVNYRVSGKQAAYVYAMAEKRAKDRVILKLVQLHGLAYSEEEADEFKQGRREEQPAAPPAEPIDPSAAQWVKEVERCVSRSDLTALFRTDEWKEAKARMTPAGQRMVQDAVARHPEYQTREVAA
jgi:hypothetical protein